MCATHLYVQNFLHAVYRRLAVVSKIKKLFQNIILGIIRDKHNKY